MSIDCKQNRNLKWEGHWKKHVIYSICMKKTSYHPLIFKHYSSIYSRIFFVVFACYQPSRFDKKQALLWVSGSQNWLSILYKTDVLWSKMFYKSKSFFYAFENSKI